MLDLQRSLRDHILAQDAPSRPPGVPTSGAPGLLVYRHAYRAQLVANLRDTYEKTCLWLGDETFDAVALAYVEKHPPSAWTLADYGDGFFEALATRWPQDPEVAELAWLDWALRRAFDGPDADPIAPEALAAVDWDQAMLNFVPTLCIGAVRTNAAAIWSSLADEETPPAAARLPEPAAIRVWRVDLSPQYRAIESLEEHALRLARDGASFASLCQDLATRFSDPDAAAQAAGGFLATWIQDGLVMAVS
ncbi:MAG: DUF2063 domain-containing protein [Cupriavidus sp.]|nr:MAG: DUF2063 domain-containing protein [Cupriavidus sp.]